MFKKTVTVNGFTYSASDNLKIVEWGGNLYFFQGGRLAWLSRGGTQPFQPPAKTVSIEKFLEEISKIDKEPGSLNKIKVQRQTRKNFRAERNNKKWPLIWDSGGVVLGYARNCSIEDNKKKNCQMEYGNENFLIYVSSTACFESNFSKFDIKFDGDNAEINRKYDYDTYFASLYAAYVATYLCGISTKHFSYDDKTPKIFTSIAQYHFYYQMVKFLADPSKLRDFVTDDIAKIVNDTRTWVPYWVPKTEYANTPTEFYKDKASGTVRGNGPLRADGTRGPVRTYVDGRYRFDFEWLTNPYPADVEGDYKLFIASNSVGLTKVGYNLLLESIESYVYCILGAQAEVRSAIIGDGAESLRVQEVFRNLVKDTANVENPVLVKRNMEKAITTTNVVLDLAISPGMHLIPSRLIILEEPIVGYSNIMRKAVGGKVKFGRNPKINYVGPPKKKSIQNVGLPSDIEDDPEDDPDSEEEPAAGGHLPSVPDDHPSDFKPILLGISAGLAAYVGLSAIL